MNLTLVYVICCSKSSINGTFPLFLVTSVVSPSANAYGEGVKRSGMLGVMKRCTERERQRLVLIAWLVFLISEDQ